MTYDLIVDQTLVLTMFFGILGLIFALAVLNLVRVAVLARRGLYKPHKLAGVWAVKHSRIRDGLTLLVVGGVVAYGIHYGLGFWVTVFILIAGVGLIQILSGLAGRRYHFR